MVHSIQKLNQILEGGERYLWHGNVLPVEYKEHLFFWSFGVVVYAATALVLFFLGVWSFALFMLAAIFALLAIKPSRTEQVLIVTDQRAVHLDKDMNVMASFPISTVSVVPVARSAVTIVVRTDTDDLVRWHCACTPKHAQHLVSFLEDDQNRTLLSS